MAEDITLGEPNPMTGAFGFAWTADDDVSFDETGAHGVVTSIVEFKGTYPFDPTHGTHIYQQKSLTSRTPSQVEAEALDGTKPLEDADEIQNVEALAEADARALGRLSLDVSWKSGTGEQQQKTIEV
jgi:hypothetical protein